MQDPTRKCTATGLVAFWLLLGAPGTRGVDSLVDSSFNAHITSVGSVHGILRQPAGQILILGDFEWLGSAARHGVARFENDGSLDPDFDPGGFFPGQVLSFALQPDGKVVLAGEVAERRYRIIRVNLDGSRDTGFHEAMVRALPGGWDPRLRLTVLGDGRIVLSGFFYEVDGVFQSALARLNANGSYDSSFAPNPSFRYEDVIWRLFIARDARLIAITTELECVRLSANGSFDRKLPADQRHPSVEFVAEQANGQLLLFGEFWRSGEQRPRYVMRLNPDDTIDSTYGLTLARPASNALTLPNGRVLIFGATNGVIELNAEGSVSRVWMTPGATSTYDMDNPAVVEPNGKLIIPGFGPKRGDGERDFGVVRYDVTGVVDSRFRMPGRLMTRGTLEQIAPLANGKLLVLGDFSHINGRAAARVARLERDGSLDTNFVFRPRGAFIDGPTVVKGNGVIFSGSVDKVLRWNPDGDRDRNYIYRTDPCDDVRSVFSLPKGKLLVGMMFGGAGGCSVIGWPGMYYRRLDRDGKVDGALSVQSELAYTDLKVPGSVDHVMPWGTNGSMVIAGQFSLVQGQQRYNIARLRSDNRVDASFHVTETEKLGHLIQGLLELSGQRLVVITGGKVVLLNSAGAVLSAASLPLMLGSTIGKSWSRSDASIVITESTAEFTQATRFSVDGQPLGRIRVPYSKGTPLWAKDAAGRPLVAGSDLRISGERWSGVIRFTTRALAGPTLNIVRNVTNATTTLQIRGDVGQAYALQTSDDLQNWIDADTGTLSNASTTISIGNAADRRFYRALPR